MSGVYLPIRSPSVLGGEKLSESLGLLNRGHACYDVTSKASKKNGLVFIETEIRDHVANDGGKGIAIIEAEGARRWHCLQISTASSSEISSRCLRSQSAFAGSCPSEVVLCKALLASHNTAFCAVTNSHV